MLRRHLTAFTLGIGFLSMLMCQQSLAQLVQIGPGYVKAPFVRIYTDSSGGTHVRAPFTSVYTPGYRYVVPPQPYSSEQPQATRRFRSPLARPAKPFELRSDDMNWRNLRRLAREGTAELYQELRRHSASQSWQDYLRTATITDLLGEDQNEPLAHEALEKLQEILRSYDAMLNANDLRSIHGRPGFQKVHAAIKELVRPPLAHQRQLVVATARDLRSELATLGRKGEDWALYLQLSSPIFKDVDYDPGSESRDGFEQLTEIISRFDMVSVDPQFALISELAGFQATHANLVTYRDMWPNDDRGEVQPKDFDGIEPIPLPIEELPIPAPNQ